MSETNGDQGANSANEELAEAFKELARGEETASKLEDQLSAIEQKIEEILNRIQETSSDGTSDDSQEKLDVEHSSKS